MFLSLMHFGKAYVLNKHIQKYTAAGMLSAGMSWLITVQFNDTLMVPSIWCMYEGKRDKQTGSVGEWDGDSVKRTAYVCVCVRYLVLQIYWPKKNKTRKPFDSSHDGILFTLCLQDPHAEEFEDKEWTFVIENVSTYVS